MQGISGTLDRLHFGDLLEWLHLTRATGRLVLISGPVSRALDVFRGKVAFASSSRASERLASWLLRKNLLDRQSLLRALAASQTRGELFTAVVEKETGVSHDTLIEAGRALATALASRVLREDRVNFNFDPSWPVADRLHIDLQLECSNLIMQAAYRVDTLPPQETILPTAATSLDPVTLEEVFWQIATELDGDLVEAGAFAEAHRTFLAVGELLQRWVTQGPPLLPLGPNDAERVAARLETGEEVRIEDSPTLIWDMLSLINGLDAPGVSRAASAHDAWVLAGDDAEMLVRLILDNSRWRRDQRWESDEALRRAALARIAAAQKLAAVAGVPESLAITAAALPVVILELVATALATSPLASPAMQRCALNHLLPLVGQAAGNAAGIPDSLITALTLTPSDHPLVRLAGLVSAAAGELQGLPTPPIPQDLSERRISSAIDVARKAVEDILAADEG